MSKETLLTTLECDQGRREEGSEEELAAPSTHQRESSLSKQDAMLPTSLSILAEREEALRHSPWA